MNVVDPLVTAIGPQHDCQKLEIGLVARFKSGIIIIQSQVRDLNSRRVKVVSANNDSLKVLTGRRIGKQVGEAERSLIHRGAMNSPALIHGEAGWMGFVKMSLTQNVVVGALSLKRARTNTND